MEKRKEEKKRDERIKQELSDALVKVRERALAYLRDSIVGSQNTRESSQAHGSESNTAETEDQKMERLKIRLRPESVPKAPEGYKHSLQGEETFGIPERHPIARETKTASETTAPSFISSEVIEAGKNTASQIV